MTREERERTFAALGAWERQLMDAEFRKDREAVSALLAEDFREFGASGRVWTKQSILAMLAEEQGGAEASLEEFAAQEIAPGAVLATYRATRRSPASASPQSSLRSSLWVLREGRWRMLFHQGTRVPSA